MKREIKFRGRDLYGAWHYGYLFQGKTEDNENYSVILKQMKYVSDDRVSEDLPFAFYKEEVSVVAPNTIGQFTGLFDKNGNEIYDGDIVRSCKYKNIKHIVSYEDKVASFLAVCIDENIETDLENKCHITQEWIDNYPKEVIGNIFDNKELLKEE